MVNILRHHLVSYSSKITLYVVVALLLFAVNSSSTSLLGNLLVEGLTSPLAVFPGFPRFSWSLGASQLSYQIQVTQVYPKVALLWNSGIIFSNQSSLIAYGGSAALPPDSDLQWNVSVDLSGQGLVSSQDIFSTAPIAPLPGIWLGHADTLRTSFFLSNVSIKRARLHATGVGCYVLYVNGVRTSPDLAPGFGHAPSARALYNTYDVTRLLLQGENVLGLRLGSCKWGAFGQYCRGSATACNAGWALLSVTQGVNTTILSTSTKTWQAANTSILYQDLWNGELFNAQEEPEGWAAPGFPFSSWAPAMSINTSDLIGPLQPVLAPPVARGPAIVPATVIAVGDDAHVFDLGPGINMAGYCALDLSAPIGEAAVSAGKVISLLHGELLYFNGNGSVWNHYLPPGGTHQPNGLNQPQMNYTYVTRGFKELANGPHFSYFGFRYIELRGWPYISSPKPDRLNCYFVHSDLKATAVLSFPSNPLLNLLQRSTVRTHLANFVSVPTVITIHSVFTHSFTNSLSKQDCPQREKRGWTGYSFLRLHLSTLFIFHLPTC